LKFDGTKFAPGTDTGLAGTVYTSTIGDGTATTFTITHSLGTRDVVVVARNAASPYEVIEVRWEATTTSAVTLDFSAAPSASSVRVGVYAAVAGSTVTIASIDDLGDVTLSSAANGDFLRYNGSVWINDAVNLSTDTIGDYVSSLVAGTAITLTNNSGEGSTPTIAVTANTFDAYGAAATAAGTAYANAQIYTNAAVRSFEINGDSGGSKTITTGNSTTAGDTFTIAGGTGLTSVTSNTDTITLNLDSTAVSAASYGSSSSVGTFTVDAQGRLTAAANSAIAITASQVTDLTKSSVGLANVDNTSDANKPVSTAQQTALDLKANLASPTFTGTVTLPDNTVALGTKTTGDYVSSLVAGTGVTLTNNSGETATPTIAIGQAVGTGASVTFAQITTTGDVVVGGNLTVSGNTTTVNTEQLNVEDNIITLNSGVTGAPTLNGGVEINRGTSTDVAILWNETTDKWTFTNDGTTYVNIASNSDIANVATSFTVAGDSGTSQTISSGTDTLTISGGTGLSSVAGATDTITLNLDSTAVTAGGYGNANTVATFTVDAQGRLTAASNAAISITASQVSDFGSVAIVKADINAKGDLIVGSADNTPAILSVGTNGYFLKANSTTATGVEWASIPTINNLDDIGDVTITSATSGDFLKWNGTAWINTPIEVGDISAVTAGTGLTGGGSSGAVTLNLASTAVAAGSYGGAGTVGTFTVDAQGRLTAAANTTISVTASQISDRATNLVTGLTGTANEITVSNSGVGAVTLSLPANVTISNNLVVTGDLTVSGNTTTVNTTQILLEDNLITLNSGEAGTPSANAGIEIERGTSTNVALQWNETTDTWQTTNDGTNYYNIITSNTAAAQVTAAAVIAAAGGDGTAGQAITTNGSGVLDFTTIVGTTEASIISAVGADGANGSVLMTNGSGDLTFTTLTAAKISDFSEAAQDAVESAITAGTGVTKAYNDGANTISLSIGQDVATNAAVTFGSIATGAITLDSGTGELNTSTQAITLNTITTVDSFDKTVYRTAKYLVQVTQGSKYTTSEVLLAHDGTTSYLSEYAVIELGGTVIPLTVSTSISGSNVLLRVTITDAATTSATVKVARTLIAV